MNVEEREALKSGWLANLPGTLADTLIDTGSLESFSAGETVYSPGAEQHSICGVAAGVLRMYVTMNEQELRLGHILGPGFWFGEAGFILRIPRLVEVVAAGPVRLCRLRGDAFGRFAGANGEAWPALARLAVMNQLIAIGAGEDLMIRNARKRLAAVLLRFASLRNAAQGTPPVLKIPVAQAELAEAAALSRSAGAAVLAEFGRIGAIATDYRTVTILNAEMLRAVLRGGR